jgi:hypothetical protein
MIISMDTDKAFEKNSTSFHGKKTKETQNRSNTFLEDNIILNGGKLKSCLLKSGMSQGCPLYRNGIPSQSTKQETEIKDI